MDTLPNLPGESNDIFSLTDDILAERLHFVREIGFGNWGSVWLCQPRPTVTKEGFIRPVGHPLAVKLVHRKAKTPTTAARVRSLWNEMKIVRNFKSDPHPAIITFHSFIITPSYALITMTRLGDPVPVEIDETKAREWFHSLLSGVAFLHHRGVVHNDIKPANILLSSKNMPVLVDFGFAEKYDLDSDTAFHSNLSYGTPEYLSPERARGLSHDTRKSDVWSLGVTFFEMLEGKTPFEMCDGEQFATSEDLERYWARTLRGKWVGTWRFSQGMEKLLQRMIAPNADLRCTAAQALKDSYWKLPIRGREATTTLSHKRASSCNSSIVFSKDQDVGPMSPPGLHKLDVLRIRDEEAALKRTLSKSKSQPKVAASKLVPPKKRNPAPPVIDLSPIKASPNSSPYSNASASANAKENILSFNRLANAVNTDKRKNQQRGKTKENVTHAFNPPANNEKEKEQGNTSVASNLMNSVRRPFGALAVRDSNLPLPVTPAGNNNNGTTGRHGPPKILAKKPSGNTHGMKAVKVLGELPNANKSVSLDEGDSYNRSRGSTSVRDRVKDWERERERLREMERLEEMERERDEIYRRERIEMELNKERKRKLREEEREEQEKAWQQQQQRDSLEAKERKNASHKHLHIKIPSAKNGKLSKSADWDKENVGASVSASRAASPVLPVFMPTSPLTNVLNIGRDSTVPSAFTRPAKETKQGIFKHSIKASIDKTMQFYKSSIGQQNGAAVNSGRSTPARGFSFDVSRPPTSQGLRGSTKDGKEAWEMEPATEGSLPEISPLPVIKNAAESERIAADARMDRMTIWMRNVEKVVEEAKQNFASSSVMKDTPLPPLPPPLSRAHSQNRTSRLPRRVLAASQIFQADENGNIKPLGDTSMTSNSAYLTADDTSKSSINPPQTATTANTSVFGPAPVTPAKHSAPLPEEGSSKLVIPEIHTPSRQRRATVSTGSPGPAISKDFAGDEGSSPSKRREKSKSHSNLLQRHIASISVLEAELMKPPPVEPPLRLSQVLDRNLFIAPPLISRDNLLDQTFENVREPSLDDLQASPCYVEPYPQRPRRSYDIPVPDTPSRHRIEGVYDRFLMATTGVKRLGKGYQSDNAGPVGSANHLAPSTSSQQQQQKGRSFYSARRPMPPPVSSDDIEQRRAASVDELGMMTYSGASPVLRSTVVGVKGSDSGNNNNATGTLMRKAMNLKKLIVPKNTASRRLSRVA